MPIKEFDSPEGLQALKEEIQIFNKHLDLKIKGSPFWITSKDKRKTQYSGSIAIALETEEQAKRAISNQLYVAGISAKVEKLHSIPKTQQCGRCQGFGHLETRCRRQISCRYCAENHPTATHKCLECDSKKDCKHIAAKCVNCKDTHCADYKKCEVFKSLLC